MAKNIFSKGQRVALQSRVGLSPRVPDEFTVSLRLPDNLGQPQYRICNEERGHERVEQGSNLQLLDNQTRG
ncbi:hypothetical protein [uncultured Hoeflea sp.]|uniref:hypothetical protein n=1 Tax=uncultured Hoeflea sp. TaxID=538666 RepID=UPI0026139743|nr:hypothetical protein [uncultured Hoeflea sp.]